MALLQFTQLTPEEILKLENNKPIPLSPIEKFRQFAKSRHLKKFHFVAVESNGEIVLFNGLGEELESFPSDLSGKRLARVHAVELFSSFSANEVVGGYKFDFV